MFLALGFAFLFSLATWVLGVNRVRWSKAVLADAFDLLPGWVLATVIAVGVDWRLGLFPQYLVLMSSGLALGGFVAARYRTRLLTGLLSRALAPRGLSRAARERVLVIGSGQNAQLAAWLFDHPSNLRKFWVVGFVDDDMFKQGLRIYGSKVLGTCQNLCKLVQERDVGLVVLADEDLAQNNYGAILEACRVASARFVYIPDILTSLHNLLEIAAPNPQTGELVLEEAKLPCLRCLARYGSITEKSKAVDQTELVFNPHDLDTLFGKPDCLTESKEISRSIDK
jgi:FlaA1/EpsC-like NDP-sugar epimerase